MAELEPLAPHRKPAMSARSVRVRYAAAMVLAVVSLVAAALIMAWLWPF